MAVRVTCNDIDLIEEVDYYWLPEGFHPRGRLILRGRPPDPVPYSFLEHIELVLGQDFEALYSGMYTPIVYVVIEDDSALTREAFFSDDENFSSRISFESELPEAGDRK